VSVSAKSQFELIEYFQQFAEQEKTGFARDLHDDLGGLLISAMMDLASLRPTISVLSEDSQFRFIRAQKALQASIEFSRRMTEQLRPTLLDNVGLFAALKWTLRDICAKSEVHCSEQFPDNEPRLNPQTGIALYRIAQEAMAIGLGRGNVKHLELTGTFDERQICLAVVADGDPLPLEPSALGNIALASMRHRAKAMKGEVVLQFSAGTGMHLTVKTPLSAPLQ
jgi:signal transduction histidine kinase